MRRCGRDRHGPYERRRPARDPQVKYSAAFLLVDIAAFEQIIQSAGAIPAVAVGLQQQMVPAVIAHLAVIVRQEIDEQVVPFTFQPGP
jgi:hypothetical protein